MRAIITALFLILFSQSAGAISNQDLYKFCKSYTDVGFDLSKMENSTSGLICMTYFRAIGDLVSQACFANFSTYEIDGKKPNFETENLEATMQEYVNTISEMPKYWKFNANVNIVHSHLYISGECPN